jgi:hypothetical protein
MEDMTSRAQALSEMAANLQKIASQFKVDDQDDVASTAPMKQTPKACSSRPVAERTALGAIKPAMPTKVKEALGKHGLLTTSE